jgi:DNA-binding XRE family transcriptional regulator
MATNSLRLARRATQKTQKRLASMVGVNVALINRLEKELDQPEPRIIVNYETAVRIARAVNLDPQELFPVTDFDPKRAGAKRRGRPSAKHRQHLKPAPPGKELARVG